MLRAVVFDFDGVVVETEEPEFLAWREAWADHGLALDLEEWAACIGTVDAFDPLAELVARAARPVDTVAVQLRRRAVHHAGPLTRHLDLSEADVRISSLSDLRLAELAGVIR